MPVKGGDAPMGSSSQEDVPGEAQLNPAYFPRAQKPEIFWSEWDRKQEAAGDQGLDGPEMSYWARW